MNDGYLSNPDEIHEGLWVDDDVDKWVKIARALKEADKTDCFYYQQAEKIVGKEKLGSCSMDEFRWQAQSWAWTCVRGWGRWTWTTSRVRSVGTS